MSVASSNPTAVDLPSDHNGGHTIDMAVDAVALVVTECVTVTAAMRRHSRWANSSMAAILGTPRSTDGLAQLQKRQKERLSEEAQLRWGSRAKKAKSPHEEPLLNNFAHLRSQLKGCKDIRQFDTTAMLHPFLQVIRSSSTSAPITSLALIAVNKFVSYNVIGESSPRLAEALHQLAAAITNCRFEVTDSSTDEVVLLRVLKLSDNLISGPIGRYIDDESLCRMLETNLSMCSGPRLSDVLRRAAEITMVTVCQVIFNRLKSLELEVPQEMDLLNEQLEDKVRQDDVQIDQSTTVPGEGEGEVEASSVAGPHEQDSPERSHEGSDDSNSGDRASVTAAEAPTPKLEPYSLKSIKELFRVLVNLLDPHDRTHNEAMRIMALRIVDVALEVAGPSIASNPSLAMHAKDGLCRHLFQLVRSEHISLLNESLRVASTLLATCRNKLKLQQELYLQHLVDCLFLKFEIPPDPQIPAQLYEGIPLAPRNSKPTAAAANQATPGSGRATPVPQRDRRALGLEGGVRRPEAREAMVENLAALVRIPSFMAELFVNYDCEIDREDLCANMVGLLARNALPDAAMWSTANVPPLCLDSLLGFVQLMHDRLDDTPVTQGFPSVEQLREQRERKRLIIAAAAKFNAKPSQSLEYLAAHGIIPNRDDHEAIARFIKGTSRVDKKVVGEYISKRDNDGILKAYMQLFNFRGLQLDEALRQLLHSFRLPGESQLIERIVEVFSEHYFEHAEPEEIATKDAVYVLTYAIIMLNTDQHNPNMKAKRMGPEDFQKNLKGVNNGTNFPDEFLEAVYKRIKKNEIILPEEHNNRQGYEHAWKELMAKTSSVSDLIICNTNVFDADIFAATWEPIVATLSYVFMSATDNVAYDRVIEGFNHCARLAARFRRHDALDRIISSLALITNLATPHPPNTSLNTTVEQDNQTMMVSETAVRLGRDIRAQIATVVLFGIVKGHEDCIREGWIPLIHILTNLFVNDLIPQYHLSFKSSIALPPIPLRDPSQPEKRTERSTDTGIFSTLSYYMTSFASDEPPEPSQQEIEYTVVTVDTIEECRFEDILVNISSLPVASLRSLLRALLAQIPDSNDPILNTSPALEPSASSPRAPERPTRMGPAYKPELVFILELATALALRDEDTAKQLYREVGGVLQSVLRDAHEHHPFMVSRCVYYILKLLMKSKDDEYIRPHVLLHSFTQFQDGLLKECAQPMLAGLSEITDVIDPLRRGLASSPGFWVILDKLQVLDETSEDVFKLIVKLFTDPGKQDVITAGTLEPALKLLNGFATAAQAGAVQEQNHERSIKRGRIPKTQELESNDMVDRGLAALAMVTDIIAGRIPKFIEESQLEPAQAWTNHWGPLLNLLAHQSLNPCRRIRNKAISQLEMTLISPQMVASGHPALTIVFTDILFPLITQLLKPEVYGTDPTGMGETRVKATRMVNRVFLHHLSDLADAGELLNIWGKIIGIMDRLKGSGQGENLEEAVSEAVKNILHILKAEGHLAPRDTTQDETNIEDERRKLAFWDATWKPVSRFLPGAFKEVFPDVQSMAQPPLPAVAPKVDTTNARSEGTEREDIAEDIENTQKKVKETVQDDVPENPAV